MSKPSLSSIHSQDDGFIGEEEILQNLVNSTYNTMIRPKIIDSTGTQQPITVSVSMHINSMDLNVQKGYVSVQLFLREQWKDPRLSYQHRGQLIPPFVQMKEKANEDFIWTPDTFIPSQKISKTSYSKHSVIKVFADGLVTCSRFLTITLPCAIDYSRYPMMNVTCVISLESYGFPIHDLDFQWGQDDHHAITLDHLQISPSNFYLHDLSFNKTVSHYTTGSYSTLNVDLHFGRAFGSDLLKFYIPSTMIVMISWISFWIYRNQIAPKAMISMSAMILMFILSTTAANQIPETSYSKPIDCWMGICFLFLFIGLIELGIVAYFDQRKRVKEAQQQNQETLLTGYQNYNHHGNKPYKGWNLRWLFRNDFPNFIDVISS
ncbi:unnamed protein product, partial [Mesorhabditis belari]|uniref:Uncharacterized protein n=1 Tax=Mesorhabditis belari TaxID=2138241 RepID=A0AAF3F6V1_9BILA